MCRPARISGRKPATSTSSRRSRPSVTASNANCADGNTAINPSPSRFTIRPRCASTAGSCAFATSRSSNSASSSPAASAHEENPTRSVNSRVSSLGCRPRPVRWIAACQTCRAPRASSWVARGSVSNNRSAIRATTAALSVPAAVSGSPKPGSPGSARRTRRRASTAACRRFAVRAADATRPAVVRAWLQPRCVTHSA